MTKLFLFVPVLLSASMLDEKLTPAQRNDVCFALRGASDPATIELMEKGLRSDAVRACAALNLRVIGAAPVLAAALEDPNPEVRISAARELGALQKLEYLGPIAKVAQDPNPVVATNGLLGLAQYEDRQVLPYLLEIAKNGGFLGILAMNRAAVFPDSGALPIARKLIDSRDISDRFAAVQVLGTLGDRTDLPKLSAIAGDHQEVVANNRGFGLMRSISVSQAAKLAMERIGAR